MKLKRKSLKKKEKIEKEKIEDFDYKNCKNYTIEQLEKYASLADINPKYENNMDLCRYLVSYYISLYEKKFMEEYTLEQIVDLANEKGISIQGDKKEICKRIFKNERNKLFLGGEYYKSEDVYINFIKEYNYEDPENTIIKYSDQVPRSFINNYKKLNVQQREEFINSYMKYENINKNVNDFLEEWIRKNFEKREVKNYQCILDSKTEIKQHQEAVVKHLMKHRGLLAVHLAGSGKSLTAVTSVECLLGNELVKNVVIITPASLVYNMKKEFLTYKYGTNWYDVIRELYKNLKNDSQEEIIKNYKFDPRVEITSYEKFSKKQKRGEYKMSETFLIVDDAHNLRTKIVRDIETQEVKKGKVSKRVIDFAKGCSKVLLLTATPIMNYPKDIVNLMAIIKGKDPIKTLSLEEEPQEFLEKYLKCNISVYMPDISKDPNFPKKEEHNVYFEMSDSYYKLYLEIEENLQDEWLKYKFGVETDLTVFINGIRRGTNMIKNNPKINYIVKKIKEENRKNENNRSVIYSGWIGAGLDLIKRKLKKKNISFAEITGKISQYDKAKAVSEYNKGNIKVLLISKAGGTGIDLKKTRHLFVTEPYWNDEELIQVKARAVRYKSHVGMPEEEQKVDIWNLFLEKPKNVKEDELPSADILLRDFSIKKKEVNEEFMKILIKNSIEKNQCIN